MPGQFRHRNIFIDTLKFLAVGLLAVPGVDWLVESNKGVFSDLAKLVVERFERGVPVLEIQELIQQVMLYSDSGKE